MRYFRKALSMPPKQLAARIYFRLSYQFKRDFTRWRDARFSTYKTARLSDSLPSYVTPPTIEALEPHREIILALANLYCDHYFDLLGSGWVQVKHGMTCMGVEGHNYSVGAQHVAPLQTTPANLTYAQRVQNLIDKNYTPIDWHLDFKSGYRWSELAPSNTLKYGDKLGADVKVPWELARAQHLPMLAYAYALTKDERYVREFRNQVLDFIATSPPRYGVNWIVAMDVGIRAANWLMAYDLFRGYGMKFDEGFEREFIQSIYQHGYHIRHHLEWSPTLRSNHYLSDIVGLLFCAAYLPSTRETDEWLTFSVKELTAETKLQFGEDGANFEASTSYHRLSAELVIYAVALITAMSVSNGKLTGSHSVQAMFPKKLWERLENMAEFTMHLTRPDGRLTQIGDNDSGRLFKLHPSYTKMTVAEAKKKYTQLANYAALPDDAIYWDENFLDHRHIVAAINGLFQRDDDAVVTMTRGCLDYRIIRDLLKTDRMSYHVERPCDAEVLRIGEQLSSVKGNTTSLKFEGDSLRDGLKCYGYPDFGVYIFRSKRLYMTVRCGSVGQRGNGGHAHSDQLSIELLIDGEPLLQDPGTYLYTPLPERRNQYRSQNVHAAPQLDREPADFSILFRMPDTFQAKCLYFGEEGFAGTIQVNGQIITRRIEIMDDHIEISDSGGISFVPQSVPMSNGYGKQLADEQSISPKLQAMLE
jgi:hypothetical protein